MKWELAKWSFPWATLGRRETSDEFTQKCEAERERIPLLNKTPHFSIVIPLPEAVSLAHFEQCLAGLFFQSYPHWDVTILAGGRFPKHRAVVDNFNSQSPQKFDWVDAPFAGGSLPLINESFFQARGEWCALVEPQDVLSPACFYQLALEIQGSDLAQVYYTNQTTVDKASEKSDAFLTKPEFSWFNLIHFNFLQRFWIVQKARFKKVGGFDPSAGLAAEHDLLLRIEETGAEFKLVPYFFYYVRAKPLAIAAESAAVHKDLRPRVAAHLARKEISAAISIVEIKGHSYLKIHPSIADLDAKKVSVIICFRDKAELTIQALTGLNRQLGRVAVEVILVNNRSTAKQVAKVRSAAAELNFPVTIIDYDHPFNFAEMHNLAVRGHATGQYLLLLNNDVVLNQDGKLDDWVSWAQFDWVGTAGCLLRYPHGGMQHSGLRALYGGGSRLARMGNSHDDNPLTYENREVFGSTFAACLIKRSTFDELGGLRALDFPNGFGDVIFNFECLRHGLKNILLGHIEGVHLESASRGARYEYWEECGIESLYPEILQKMLRYDLGYGRIPDGDYPIRKMLRDAVLAKVREKMPWLAPIKPVVKKMLRYRFLPEN